METSQQRTFQPPPLPPLLARPLEIAKVDFAPRHRQPGAASIVAATFLAIAGSLVADLLLVRLGKAMFPTTARYEHFQVFDYARLTIIGVILAAAGWPIVTRISSAPRWLYVRLAVLVSGVLLLPDVYLWLRGDPHKAIAVLVVMHAAIALVTYNVVVRLAPASPVEDQALAPDPA